MLAAISLALAVVGLPHPIRADFDHDGKADIAEVVAAKGRYQLVIRRGAAPGAPVVLDTFDRNAVRRLYIEKSDPGRWQTWCGKGGGTATEPCPHDYVILRGDTLAFGMEEASMSVAIWNGRRFDVVLLSD